MKQLVAFFETDPREIAQQFFIKKVVLQTLFKNKNLYRYHRDFAERWRLIHEQGLVRDLAQLRHSKDLGEKDLYQILKKNKIPGTLPTAQGFEDFLDHFNYRPFADMAFCNKLISQVQEYRESEQEELYSLLQTFLFYFASAYETQEPRLSRQWQSLSSFFAGPQGEITPFFRAISAHLLYTISGRSRSSSGGHLKGASAQKSKKIPNNILGLPSKLNYEREFLLKTIKNIQSQYQKGAAAHAFTARPLIEYFEEQYDVRVHLHSENENILLGFFPKNQSEAFWVSEHECRLENAARLYDKLLDLYLEDILRGKIVDVFKADPFTPEHHLASIGETDESDCDVAGSDDFDIDWSISVSSDSGRMRASSLDAHWSSFGDKWRRKKESEKLPYLLKGLSQRYGWPQDFLTVALSSLNPEAVVISERDCYILTKEQIQFQVQTFQTLRAKWDRSSIETLSQAYNSSAVVFPFIEQKSVAETILSSINRNNIFFKGTAQRYKYIDTLSLEILMAGAHWDESLDREFITEAFSSSSLQILESVLAKKRVLKGPWLEVLKRGLFEKNWDMVERFINNFNRRLTKEEWALLVSWAIEREEYCGLQEMTLYFTIGQQFQAFISQEAECEIWHGVLCTEPALFEKRVIFCSKWGYPDNPAEKSFFESLDMCQKIARYECWLEALHKKQLAFEGFWRLILNKETEIMSKEVARLCLADIATPESLFQQIKSIGAGTSAEEEALVCQLYALMIKIYLHHRPEDYFTIMQLLFKPSSADFVNESVHKKLRGIFSRTSAEQLIAQYEKIQQADFHKIQPLRFSQSLPAQEVSLIKKRGR